MNRLKQLREEKKITQEELAKQLGLSKGIISLYEKEERKPSLEVITKLCNIFECSMDYLMGNSENRNLSENKNSVENLQKYYKEKIDVVLKNKYINEFLELGLANLEIENLIKVISSEEDSINENYSSLIDGLLSVISLNHNENIVKQTKDLIIKYNQEKLAILKEELNIAKEYKKKTEQKLVSEHINELHPAILGKKSSSLEDNLEAILAFMDKNGLNNCYMCPVYGRISAGIPNWAEECIEGRLPIDPVMFNIINPEEHFFLKVNRRIYE